MSKTKNTPFRDTIIHATFVTQRNAPSDGFLFLWGPPSEHFNWIQGLRQIGLKAGDALSLRPTQAHLIIPAKDGRYSKETVSGVALEICDVIELFGTSSLSFNESRRRICPSMLVWSLASKFALELISRQCFVPSLRTYRHELYGAWQLAHESSVDVGRINKLANAMPPCAHCLLYTKHWDKSGGRGMNKRRKPTMMWHPEALLRAFLDASIDAYVRKTMHFMLSSPDLGWVQDMLRSLPRRNASMPIRDLLKLRYNLDIEEALKSLTLQSENEQSMAKEAIAVDVLDEDEELDEEGDDESEDDADSDDTSQEDDNEDESVKGDDACDCKEASCEAAVDPHDANQQNKAIRFNRRPHTPAEYRTYLMPQKEFVYTAFCELEDLPRWESRWFDALVLPKDQSRIQYHLEDPDLVESIQAWLSPIHEGTNAENVTAKTGFWLEAPNPDDPAGLWFLHYMLVAQEDPDIAIDAKTIFSFGAHLFRLEQHSFENPQEQLLTDLGKAAAFFEPIQGSLNKSAPEGVYLDVKQAWTFISEASPMLLSQGFDVRLPEQLKEQGTRRLRARLRIKDAMPEDFGSDKSLFGLNDLAAFQWEAALGDDVVSVDEFREIVALKQPLIKWHGSWVLVDPVQLNDIEALIDDNANSTGTITRFDAMSRALSGVADPNHPDANIEVVVEGKLVDVLSKLSQEDVQEITMKAPPTFVGTLRPYQERGVAWLSYQERIGLGCCLADDMGLGKTIQLICHILNHMQRYPADTRGFLLICPMSVVGNWRREFERFAPSINVIIHHGSDRAQSPEALKAQLTTPGTVIITTYGLITRCKDIMYAHHWAMVVLDEAQAIKNATSKRAISVRSLQSDFRVALTGTPIENRLSELWSILDFLNPGLLGTSASFQRLYAAPIERYNDKNATERLRNLVTPFIMRRVKTDPSIIQDLPEKMEHKVYCTLTREQATMYQALVDSTMHKIEDSAGIARHGQILALLTHLKQIVDHPALFQKNTTLSAERSGKAMRLIEMLETVIENGEKALIFTQFKEMGDALVEILQEALNLETIPFLHGGLSSSQRDELVDVFQSQDGPPIFILSLKAGGTGLNLTAASHVFHYDRWWNPAVEEQATDRAFRIGQKKNVQVHKFLSIGSLEEKIDLMLEEKKGLSNAIVDASGAWVTQLDTDALRELFTLNKDAVLDDAE